MPPKKDVKKEPVLLDTLSVESELQEMHEREDSLLYCQAIVDLLLRNAQESVFEREMDQKKIGFVVDSITQDLHTAIKLLFVKKDDGEKDVDGKHPSYWIPDEEPQPIPIDTWARGAVPLRRRMPMESGEDVPKKSLSVASSRRSMRSNVSGRRKDSRSAVLSSDSAAAKRLQAVSPTGFRKKSVDPSKKAGGEKSSTTTAATRHLSPEELQALAEEEDRKELQRLHTQFKGKDFTYDYHGNPIEVLPVDYDRLPNPRVQTKVSVNETQVAQQEIPPPEKRGTSKAASRSRVSRKKKSAVSSSGRAFRESTASRSPMVKDVEAAPGVTLRQGSLVRTGPQKERDDKRMSKKDFAKFLEKERMEGTMSLGAVPVAKASIRKQSVAPSAGKKSKEKEEEAAKKAAEAETLRKKKADDEATKKASTTMVSDATKSHRPIRDLGASSSMPRVRERKAHASPGSPISRRTRPITRRPLDVSKTATGPLRRSLFSKDRSGVRLANEDLAKDLVG
eukprot:TRINITY_DN593_c0_g1_i1.p1 TRINITY_DN593_c0_g1~~TRINITY_DN593_c0_g1_i1.p1  ORF type:complete len:508 (-),score=172.09 TRINITY_DN593_c0_g1_i1:94-1617(-)